MRRYAIEQRWRWHLREYGKRFDSEIFEIVVDLLDELVVISVTDDNHYGSDLLTHDQLLCIASILEEKIKECLNDKMRADAECVQDIYDILDECSSGLISSTLVS